MRFSRRRRRRQWLIASTFVALVSSVLYWYLALDAPGWHSRVAQGTGAAETSAAESNAGAAEARAADGSLRFVAAAALPGPAEPAPHRAAAQPDPIYEATFEPVEPDPAGDETRSDNPAIEALRQRWQKGEVIEARHALNALLTSTTRPADQSEIRALLTKIADETIFSPRVVADDPLVSSYRVQSGDRLATIGPKYKVPYELIMQLNGIRDAGKLRLDQTIKIPKGPFHVRISKSQFRMDVYLQDLYVRSYRVGLGRDSGTPEGKWVVKNRLKNPTYFPPASATDKRVIAADDPQNPLGEFWIGLEYVDGGATNTEGYGIHGTIDPDSIGKDASSGCIRMHNEDVAFVYGLLRERESTVTTQR